MNKPSNRTYTFHSLLDKKGQKIQKPKGIPGTILDIDKAHRAVIFSGLHSGANLLGDMYVMEFEAHASGLFLRGVERTGSGRAIYHEWYLAYEGA